MLAAIQFRIPYFPISWPKTWRWTYKTVFLPFIFYGYETWPQTL